ncbi:acetate/propionate family kinase [Rhodospirillum rubrum]|uniref:Acetate kinase n=1 Tax=Rhodospirillum rubrum (strain ATCC 11170 / ATH 1.1.1 / DSM 467 / LMG 4362 / NCIMB 8255 / S1) TaxID=269796 RepID=Q2RVX4_RHORT|nr:acetate kinase [Rhodospirillum rubrum]ABC21721.1 acetate kinase [Rhodospirillum rubrum ATCC 11170]AEO47419.1 acetate kinase [Rhodospirillum rubrum F11]MBK5953273.1 acetate kinase [Rhodospirillum rubrum]QXG81383.1 acetate kinase [Rhodospirillum rubrum]HAQ01164.1 acetate kinase [Rhodospirillum rubrum]
MILTINCGSSSLKYQLYTPDLGEVAAKGIISRIGEAGTSIDHRVGGRKIRQDLPGADHAGALEAVIANLLHPEWGAIGDIAEIEAIGHRAVHGGDTFVESVLVTDEVIAQLEECTPLAPLHNPVNLVGIREARRLLPDVPHVVVFDTSFHQGMPPHAHVFALPYHYYAEHKIRRYGFHGTSCRYVSARAAEILGRPIEDLRMVICHLGNGVTIDAVSGGRSVDTSIGFGTFSGVMMGTRSGDFDPGLIFYMHKKLNMSLSDIEAICYKESGLLGVSGVSNDMREVVEQAVAGNARCALAIDMFVYMVRKFVGSYAAAMDGIDALVFTAGIGENSAYIRSRISHGLEFLGVELDDVANDQVNGAAAIISPAHARAATMVVPTDEEKMIALDTLRLSGGLIGRDPAEVYLAAAVAE